MVERASNVTSLDERKKEGAVMRAMSTLLQRAKLAISAGVRFAGKRDFYGVFGYEQTPTPTQFLAKYTRQDIVSRIIDAPPDATWSSPPEMQAGRNLTANWKKLTDSMPIWTTFHRADRLSRLGEYSLILLGFDDARSLSQPVKGGSKLIYMRPLGVLQAEIKDFIDDPRSPRYGRPETYTIAFDDPLANNIRRGRTKTFRSQKLDVHWSRMVHIVENPLDDDVVTTPIIEKVFNALDDLMKVVGGASETYWLTATRGMQADVDKDMEIDPADAEALADEIEEYQHQLRRFIRTRGVKLNVLDSKMQDPATTFDIIMSVISGTTGIPKRILLGAEAGQLASEQDRANWAERIIDRRILTAEPYMLKPFVNHLQELRVLPSGLFTWEWPEAFRVSPLERSQTMAAQARAAGNLSRQTGNNTPMQITSREESRQILGLKGDLKKTDLYDPNAVPQLEKSATSSNTPPGQRGTNVPPGQQGQAQTPQT